MTRVEISWDHILRPTELDSQIDYLENHGGLYIWIFDGKPSRVSYIGETGQFFGRFVQHFTNYGGLSTVIGISPDEDLVMFLKQHFDGKTIDEINAGDRIYIPTITGKHQRSFTRAFLADHVWKMRFDYLKHLRIAFGTLIGVEDGMRKEVEAALIDGVRKSYRSIAGSDLRLRAGMNREMPIGSISRYPSSTLEIIHSGLMAMQLPPEVTGVTSYVRRMVSGA